MDRIVTLHMSVNYMLPSKPVVKNHRQHEEKIMIIITINFIKDNKVPKTMPSLPLPFGKMEVALRYLLAHMMVSGGYGTQQPSQKNSNII